MDPKTQRVITFDRLRMADVPQVGGKNASLGEMIGRLASAGIRVPRGFATTTAAFHEFLAANRLAEKIASRLSEIDVENVGALAKAGSDVRRWVADAPLPQAFVDEIGAAYAALERENPRATFARIRKGLSQHIIEEPNGLVRIKPQPGNTPQCPA